MSAPASNLPGLMGIWAHPDDEAFSMGGILARAASQGHPTALVCATRGEEGKIAEGTNATQETLGAVREQELRSAAVVLGVRWLWAPRPHGDPSPHARGYSGRK